MLASTNRPIIYFSGPNSSGLDSCRGAISPSIHGDVSDDGQIMGDEKVGESQVSFEAGQQVDNLGLNGNVQGRDRFIADKELRGNEQRARDADPLALSPAEFVRVFVGVCGLQADGSP